MKQSIRSHIEKLIDSDLLLRVKKEVNPRFEIPALMQSAEKLGKAILFEKVKDSKFPVINNVLGSRTMAALLFETSPGKVSEEFVARQNIPVLPKVIKGGAGEYVRKTGKDVNLLELPIVTHSDKDVGPYITLGAIIAKDPETGIRNVSINRMMLKDKNTLGVSIRAEPDIGIVRHLGAILKKSEKMNRGLPVAVVIGNHPFVNLVAAAMWLPFGRDEFELASSLFKEPMELVDCDTVDLQVPAHSEIVLEGEVLANLREPEGPFGDFQQTYGPMLPKPVIKINAIKYKKDAIYQTQQASSLEDMYVLGLSREAQIFEAVQNTDCKVKAVNLVPNILGCAISIEKQCEGEAKQVLLTAFGAYYWLKFCVVVDHDVDVFNIDDVWWAMASRADLGNNTIQMTDVRGLGKVGVSKLGIDATAPLDQWDRYRRKYVPGASEIKLEDYL